MMASQYLFEFDGFSYSLVGHMKTCKACLKTLPLEDFYRAKETRHGRGTKCKKCMRAYTAMAYRRNRTSRDRAVTCWRKKFPEKARALSKRTYDRSAELMRMRTILRKYGLTLDQYHSMYEAQDFCCYLCGRYGPLQVDHDHETQRVRRMLCRQCNSALGQFCENPALMRAAADYVERHRYGAR